MGKYSKLKADLQDLHKRCCIHLTVHQLHYIKYKRWVDVIISLISLIVLAPLFLAVIILQKISDFREPVFFRQQRVGKDGKIFTIIKFRSMKTSAPSNVPTGEFVRPEEYISSFGSFLRKTSIDELPQLWNVLIGEMSLIGPRPLIPEEEEIHFLRWYYGIYALRPGITGWAQINGRDLINIYEKTYFDREYLKNLSLSFDLRVLWQSVQTVLGQIGFRDGTEVHEEYVEPGVYIVKRHG